MQNHSHSTLKSNIMSTEVELLMMTNYPQMTIKTWNIFKICRFEEFILDKLILPLQRCNPEVRFLKSLCIETQQRSVYVYELARCVRD